MCTFDVLARGYYSVTDRPRTDYGLVGDGWWWWLWLADGLDLDGCVLVVVENDVADLVLLLLLLLMLLEVANNE